MKHDLQEFNVQGFDLFFSDLVNHIVNNPYKILFADGDYTCSVADFTGTFKGPMKGFDRQMIQPTDKKFQTVLYRCDMEGWKDYRGEAIIL